MARITAVINQKGGVGKTTSAHALATGLQHRGFKTLVIDADAQGNISATMQADAAHSGLYELMRGDTGAVDAAQSTKQGDIISSSLFLAGADMEFMQTGREYLLKEAIEPLEGQYSHIVIDCPPALGIMTINALTAASDVVIPLGADVYSLQGLQQLLTTIERVRKYSNHDLRIAGLLITRKGTRATATRQLIEAIAAQSKAMGLNLYSTPIREAIAVKEAQITRTSLFDAAPRAKVTEDYNRFIDEYLKQEER